MKLIVTIIACILLIGCCDLAAASEACGCQPCGPGGKACAGCPERVPLCKDFINILSDLERKVRLCVCGEQAWML